LKTDDIKVTNLITSGKYIKQSIINYYPESN